MLQRMKKILFILLALLPLAGINAQQQKIMKRSHIPYAFKDFKNVKIKFAFGGKGTAKANIFLRDASLIYLKDSVKMKANLFSVLSVDFGDTVYRKVGDQMGRVVAEKNGNFLVDVTTIDMDAIHEAERHGDNTQFLDLPEFNVFIDTHADYYGKDESAVYPLKDTYYFIHKGDWFPAYEREFKKHLRADKKNDFKELMKNRFWSWWDEKSLLELLDYL